MVKFIGGSLKRRVVVVLARPEHLSLSIVAVQRCWDCHGHKREPPPAPTPRRQSAPTRIKIALTACGPGDVSCKR